MKLHYADPCCPHNGQPTAPLRLLYAQELWGDAQIELERLDALQLDDRQRLVVRIYKAAIAMISNKAQYSEARWQLVLLEREVVSLTDDRFVADFRGLRISLAHRLGDQRLVTALITGFFDGIERTPATEALWRIAQGRARVNPRDAITYYMTAAMNLDGRGLPCLREMATRRQALCLHQIGDDVQAVSVLRSLGIPASTMPAEGEIALRDLLLVS